MAKVNPGALRNWQDGDVIHGAEYNGERNLLVAAYNDTQDQVDKLKSTTTPAISTGMIQDGAVTNPKLATGAVTDDKIANDTITTGKIKDGNIVTPKLAAGAVTEPKIGDKAVSTRTLGDQSVTNAKLAAGAVQAANLGSSAVTTDKMADASVTGAKLANASVENKHLTSGSVAEANLQDGSVGTGKLKSKSVTTTKIADKAVTIQQMSDNSVSTDQIVDGAVTSSKLAAGAVTPSKITEEAVTQFAYTKAETDQKIGEAIASVIPQGVIDEIKQSIASDVAELKNDVGDMSGIPVSLAEAYTDLNSEVENLRTDVSLTETAVAAAQAKADAAETPAGAQAKANAAETNAKSYADTNFFNRNTFARPNLLKNSSGYMGLANWRNGGAGTWSTFQAVDVGSLFFINDAVGAGSYAILDSDPINVNPGSKMIIAADFNTRGTTTGTVLIEIKKSDGTTTIGSVVADLNSNWHRRANMFIVPNDVGTVFVRLVVTNVPAGWKSFARIKLSYTFDNDPAGTKIPYTNEADTAALFQYANDGKGKIATAISGKGVAASSSDTFDTLASKIGRISTGTFSALSISGIKSSGWVTGFPMTLATFATFKASNLRLLYTFLRSTPSPGLKSFFTVLSDGATEINVALEIIGPAGRNITLAYVSNASTSAQRMNVYGFDFDVPNKSLWVGSTSSTTTQWSNLSYNTQPSVPAYDPDDSLSLVLRYTVSKVPASPALIEYNFSGSLFAY